MNKKVLGFALAFIFIAAMATPMALARPGGEKSNDKFDYFYLQVSGFGSGTNDKFWYTPPNADVNDNKTQHARGGGWVTFPESEVYLIVGEDEFRTDTDPVHISWTTTFNTNLIRFNNGTTKSTIIKLTDVVTVYDGEEEIGTLVLELKSSIKLGVGSGTVQGYGTGAFEGVKISAVDLGVISITPGTPPIVLYAREGTITGWPL
jgi:hypothetical protein